MVEKITKSLSLTIPPHVLRSRDPRALLTTVFGAWLPLSTALLVSVIEYLPAPPAAQSARLPGLIDASPGADHVDRAIRDAMVNFKASKNDPIVAYVSKMVAIPASQLPENKRKGGSALSAEEAREMAQKKRAEVAKAQAATENTTSHSLNGTISALASTVLDDDDENRRDLNPEEYIDAEHLIGFARLYSGTLSVGDSVYVLPPKFSPAYPYANLKPQKVTITSLYLLMGRGLEVLTSVPAGVIFGIGGLEGHVLKTATLCSQLEGSVNLAGISMGNQPIVRVALEPVVPSDLEKMVAGMRLLEQSDPCAQYEVLENGEHVILTAGELHLERCLKDLRERFARCEIQAGEPIVPYRESIVQALEMAPPKDKDLPRGTVIGITSSKQMTVRLRVQPIPEPITQFLEKSTIAIRRLYAEKKAVLGTEDDRGEEALDTDGSEITAKQPHYQQLSLSDFKRDLQSALMEVEEQREFWSKAIENIAGFGPRRTGPNLLIDETKAGACQKL